MLIGTILLSVVASRLIKSLNNKEQLVLVPNPDLNPSVLSWLQRILAVPRQAKARKPPPSLCA